jgi:hypothetical protein
MSSGPAGRASRFRSIANSRVRLRRIALIFPRIWSTGRQFQASAGLFSPLFRHLRLQYRARSHLASMLSNLRSIVQSRFPFFGQIFRQSGDLWVRAVAAERSVGAGPSRQPQPRGAETVAAMRFIRSIHFIHFIRFTE